MRRLAAVLALAVAAAPAGAARADTFTVVRTPVVLPSAEVPNAPGSVVLPEALLQPPTVPARRSYGQLLAIWQRAGAAYGIPWPVLASINKVESNFGSNMGPSSANAIGWMQFLPATWSRWGLDASGDGVADPWNPEDAVYASARYLAAAGGRYDIARAVYAYNHAQWYVDEVLQLAGMLGRGGGGNASFVTDRLRAGVDSAAADVAAVKRRLAAVRARMLALQETETGLRARAEALPLLSDQLAAHKRAGQAGVARAAVEAEAAALEAELGEAESRLATEQERLQAASFAPGADALLAATAPSGDYVFPVGGGPGVVSVAHDHHDYPAADIAAPEGSPVYALSGAIVERAWHAPVGRCGIGLTLRTEDGQAWTYCHLSYLDESIGPGSFLPTGAPVGLVGSTGHATGPHLHLQLQPPTAYPQEQPWFRAFAGSAFTWQDWSDDAESVVMPHPVFAVVPGAGAGVVAFTR